MKTKSSVVLFSILLTGLTSSVAQPGAATSSSRKHLADYDGELRLPNGRVDTTNMVRRLQELRVTTYYWLIAHAATDWEDLKLFLPQASRSHIDVWPYLVPPSQARRVTAHCI